MTILSVIGARPHFMKAAPFMEAMKDSDHKVYTIHTGQHYDANMSDVFFSELGLPKPDVNLGIGSGSHATQTAAVLTGVEEQLLDIKPDAVVVYGDTNTTLGAALAASKLYIPVVHVEAGVRCGNWQMPEEINRIIIDNISDFLCCTSKLAVENLRNEGIVNGAHNIGDFMYDNFLKIQEVALKADFDLASFGVSSGEFILATMHREEATASPETLTNILNTLGDLGYPVLLPLHPRTSACLEAAGIPLQRTDGLRIIEPVSNLDMISLLSHAKLVLTDSGGLQKEAFWSKVPCVTLMRETGWFEIVDAGWNVVAGLDPKTIRAAVENYLNNPPNASEVDIELYGAPGAARRMVKELGWI